MTWLPKILLLGAVGLSVGLAWWNHGKKSTVLWGPAAAAGAVEVLLLWWSWS